MEKVRNQHHTAKGIIVTALVFLLMIGVLALGLSQVNSRNSKQQAQALEDAVRRAVMLCYAVQGRYPTDAQELRDHYGLTYDEDQYIVIVDGFASNLLPDIRVLSLGGAGFE